MTVPLFAVPTSIDGKLRPIYKWAGGKRKLWKDYESLFPNLHNYHTYVEPFFGGGAIYAKIRNTSRIRNSYINDINTEIIGIFEAIKYHPQYFIDTTTEISEQYLKYDKEERKNWYYNTREEYWDNPTPELLYVLMRLSFNGIWKNIKASNGMFGTGRGLLNQKNVHQIMDKELIQRWHIALQDTHISNKDYRELSTPIGPGVLVYCDPPYRDCYTTYAQDFGDPQQEEFCKWAINISKTGAKVIISGKNLDDDNFFQERLPGFSFTDFHVIHTAGEKKKTPEGFMSKHVSEFLAISPD